MSQAGVAALITEYLRASLTLKKIWELHSRRECDLGLSEGGPLHFVECAHCMEDWPCRTAKIIMDIDDLPSIPPTEEAGA